MTVPDEDLTWNEETGHYDFGEIDWEEFFQVISGFGPCNHQRIEQRRQARDEGKWVVDAAEAYAQKQAKVEQVA